jgi:hypothetical protein
VDRLGGFLLVLALGVGAILFLFIALWSLIILLRIRHMTRGHEPVVSGLGHDRITANRATRLLLPAVGRLGFERLGLMGARWPWDRQPFPSRVAVSPDRRTVASIIETTGSESVVVVTSTFADGFEVSTVHPEELRHLDVNVDHLGTLESPAAAFQAHLERVETATANHGDPRRIATLTDVIETELPGHERGVASHRRAILRSRVRRHAAIASVSLVATILLGYQVIATVAAQEQRPPVVVWEAVDAPGGHVYDVIALDGRFVAVGSTFGTAGERAAAWASDDGRSWRIVVDEAAATNRGSSEVPESAIWAVTEHAGGLVAVGTVTAGELVPAPTGRVWTSSDGLAWRSSAAVELAGYAQFVASDGRRLVVAGRLPDPDTPSRPVADGVLWTSLDRRTWQLADAPRVDFFDHVVHGRAGFVALGVADVGTPDGSRTVLLHSADGMAWASASGVPPRDEGAPEQLLATDDGYVAVGAGGVWHSTEGRSWTRTTDPANFADAWFHGVVAGDAVFLAVGERGDTLHGEPSSWTSLDGRHWQFAGALDPERGVAPYHVAVHAERAVVFGLGRAWAGTILDR